MFAVFRLKGELCMKKKVVSLVMVILLIFANVFQMIGSIATVAGNAIYGEPPVNSSQYEEWKQWYVNNGNFSFLNGSSAYAASISGNVMYNSYLELAVANNSRYTIGTSGGNPDISTDNYKRLLFGHPSPSTSYTTIRINGTNYKYGDGSFVVNPTFNEQFNTNTSEQKIGNLSIKQVLSLVKNTATQREDIVEIKYIIKNMIH